MSSKFPGNLSGDVTIVGQGKKNFRTLTAQLLVLILNKTQNGTGREKCSNWLLKVHTRAVEGLGQDLSAIDSLAISFLLSFSCKLKHLTPAQTKSQNSTHYLGIHEGDRKANLQCEPNLTLFQKGSPFQKLKKKTKALNKNFGPKATAQIRFTLRVEKMLQ